MRGGNEPSVTGLFNSTVSTRAASWGVRGTPRGGSSLTLSRPASSSRYSKASACSAPLATARTAISAGLTMATCVLCTRSPRRRSSLAGAFAPVAAWWASPRISPASPDAARELLSRSTPRPAGGVTAMQPVDSTTAPSTKAAHFRFSSAGTVHPQTQGHEGAWTQHVDNSGVGAPVAPTPVCVFQLKAWCRACR
ncbi:hypothetical protein ACN28S_41395 [Cystobacter fuscus]